MFFDSWYSASGSFSAASATTIASPSSIQCRVDETDLEQFSTQTIDVNTASWWDTTSPTNYTTPANRAGLDFYIYACIPTTGKTPKLLLSANATYPSGYTASTSRKLGGFHCLCASMSSHSGWEANTAYAIGKTIIEGSYWYRCVVAGTSHATTKPTFGTTIEGTTADSGTLVWICEEPHPLYGFVAGDVLPYSVWDLKHRAENHNNQGRVYDPKQQLWVDIYLPSLSGLSAVSVNGGTILDTAQWWGFVGYGLNASVRMLKYSEFASAAYGSNEMAQISTGTYTSTAGGHTDAQGRRMLSFIGCEDCVGVAYQWGMDTGYRFDGATNHTHTLTLTGDAQTGVATSTASADVAPAWSYKTYTNYHGSLYVQGTYGITKPLFGGKHNLTSNVGSLFCDVSLRPWASNTSYYSTRYCCKTKEL